MSFKLRIFFIINEDEISEEQEAFLKDSFYSTAKSRISYNYIK
jgi:hypothetical protein